MNDEMSFFGVRLNQQQAEYASRRCEDASHALCGQLGGGGGVIAWCYNEDDAQEAMRVFSPVASNLRIEAV